MQLVPITEIDRSWSKLKSQWETESASLREDFSTFAVGTFSALDPLAFKDARESGLFGLRHEDSFVAFCQVSRLLVKKYTSPMLRARFVTVSPKFDFGVASLEEYANVLVQIFSGVVWLARSQLPASHLRFHLRSPADAQYFAGLQACSIEQNPFREFGIRGSWVECTLRAG